MKRWTLLLLLGGLLALAGAFGHRTAVFTLGVAQDASWAADGLFTEDAEREGRERLATLVRQKIAAEKAGDVPKAQALSREINAHVRRMQSQLRHPEPPPPESPPARGPRGGAS